MKSLIEFVPMQNEYTLLATNTRPLDHCRIYQCILQTNTDFNTRSHKLAANSVPMLKRTFIVKWPPLTMLLYMLGILSCVECGLWTQYRDEMCWWLCFCCKPLLSYDNECTHEIFVHTYMYTGFLLRILLNLRSKHQRQVVKQRTRDNMHVNWSIWCGSSWNKVTITWNNTLSFCMLFSCHRSSSTSSFQPKSIKLGGHLHRS